MMRMSLAVLVLVACSTRSTEPKSAAPASAASSPREAAIAHAERVLDRIIANDAAAVRAEFDATMTEKLSEAELRDTWPQIQQQFGEYQSHDQATVTRMADKTVVQLPLHMSKSDAELRLAFDANDKIAGIYFLRPGVPL